MNRSVQTLCYLISALSVIGGFSDIAVQFFEGQEIHWRIPLILIGTGAGLPIIIFPFYTPPTPKEDEHDYDDNDLSNVYQDGQELMSSSGNGSSSSDYNDYGGGINSSD